MVSANKTGSTNSLAYDGAGRLRQTTWRVPSPV
ncbi:MAG: hypothetical protein HS120_08235 [Burkholderiales bacterium]|nr:hypothetical protein [Burkholderiales bacterium]